MTYLVTLSTGAFAQVDVGIGEKKFVGFLSDTPISSISFTTVDGIYGGISGITVDNLTFGQAKGVNPTPALLPGLIGMGFAAIRKRKSAQKEAVEV